MASEKRSVSKYGDLFEYLPVAIWEEDFSEVKAYLYAIPGIENEIPEDLFIKYPRHLDACISRIKVVNINQAVVELFGAEDKRRLKEGMMREIFTQDTLNAFQHQFIAILRNQTQLELETSIKTMAGEKRNMQLRWFVPPGYEQTLERVLVVMTDITDRLQVEKAERQSLQRLRQVIDLVPHMIFAKDLNGKFHLANKAIADALGTNVDELVGKTLQDFYPHEADLIKWINEDEEVILTGKPMHIPEEDFHDAKGVSRIMQTTKIPFTEFGSNEEVLLGVSLDITQRKNQQKELENYLAILRGVFDSSPDGIVVVHKEEGVVHYNQRFANIWGLPHEILTLEETEPGFQKFLDQVKSPEALLKLIKEGKSDTEKRTKDLLEFKDGRVFQVLARHYYLQGEYGGRVWFFHDITDRLSTENELLERNFELDSFVYRASHDLKAPLNSIMGLIEISRGETEDPVLLSYLELMTRSVTKLDTFIRNLADFSSNRNLGPARDRINFVPLLDGILENASFMDGYEELEIRPTVTGTGEFYSDPVRIKIILSNLISNAVKYRDLHNPSGYIEVNIRYNPEEAIIRVGDNGIGIEKEHHDKVFRMFYRAHVQGYGAGLGLYVVEQSVRRLSGVLTLQSSPTEGTTVIIKVPSAQA